MSWSDTAYLKFDDVVQARYVLEGALGPLPAGETMTAGTHGYFLVAPIVEWLTQPAFGTSADGAPVMTDPGQQRTGYWAMLRMCPEWDGYASADTALTAYSQAINNPNNAFSGDAADIAEGTGQSFTSKIMTAVKSFLGIGP